MENGVQTTSGGSVSRERWFSASTWLALAIVLVYIIFTFGFPLIPVLIQAGSMEDMIHSAVPILSLILWLVGMGIRILVRKKRNQLIWSGLRYGIVAFGVAGLLVMIVGGATPGYIRATQKFQKQMQKEADIPSIRAWAETFQPSAENRPTIWGGGVFIDNKQWPECIKKLNPNVVQYSTEDKTMHLIFGGGFGHWGLSVGPKGTPTYGDYTLPLEDGAWVWHDIQ
jgi:hypothetical protein